MQVLKVGVLDEGFKPFAPQGEAQVCEFPPHCGSLWQRWSLWQDCVSASPTCFNVGFYSFTQCVGATQLVMGILSVEIVLYVAVGLMCPWEEVGS